MIKIFDFPGIQQALDFISTCITTPHLQIDRDDIDALVVHGLPGQVQQRCAVSISATSNDGLKAAAKQGKGTEKTALPQDSGEKQFTLNGLIESIKLEKPDFMVQERPTDLLILVPQHGGSDILGEIYATIPRRGLVIIISDLYDDEREIVRALRHFRHKRHGVMLFHILDHQEVDFEFDRLTNFVDMETNETIHADPRYVRAEYLKLIKEFTESFRRDCAESQIEYVLTNTSVSFDFMLSRFLQARSRIFR